MPIMILSFGYILIGLILLVWSADRFVAGSAVAAKRLGMPPLLIGMVVVGFGTSAPEILVSGISAFNGNPGIALGNAFGSNICNIALILGITALINPISVESNILKKELPVLTLVTVLIFLLISNCVFTRIEAVVLLVTFSGLLALSIYQQAKHRGTSKDTALETIPETQARSLGKAVWEIVYGLVILVFSSRILVTGAVDVAQGFGISDLLIGLTIVAAGTSLPELAASIAAARKNEHDIVLGNVIGANLFNTLAVIGIAGIIHPMDVAPVVLYRDLPVMSGLTISLFFVGYGFRGRGGRINRWEGLALLTVYVAYTAWLIVSQM